MNRNNIIYLVLFLLVIFGFCIRVYRLDSIPAGFFADEASTGYNAYKILLSGKDMHGQSFPVFFRSFGEYRGGVPFYVTAVSIFFLGLNEFASRFPSAVIGTLTIITTFFLTKVLLSKKEIGLLASFFIAISPWHIQFSRYAEGNIYFVFFYTLGLSCLLYGLKIKKYIFSIAGALSFSLGIYTYFQAFYLIPLTYFFIFLLYKKYLIQNKIFSLLLTFILVLGMLPLLHGFLDGEALARYNQLLPLQKTYSVTEVADKMFNTYVEHFGVTFLFLEGDIGMKNHFITRHSVLGFGELFIIQLPLIILGLCYSYRSKRTFYVLLFWLAIYPIGSTLAPFADGGGPAATRSIIGVVPFQILSAAGLYFLYKLLSKRIKLYAIMTILLITLFSFLIYIHAYYFKYIYYSSDFWGWQYGAKDIVNYFDAHKNSYDQFIMSPEFNAPDIFLKFYAPNGCTKCIVENPDKVYNPMARQLFAITPEYLKAHPEYKFITEKKIMYPNGGIAFLLGEIIQ